MGLATRLGPWLLGTVRYTNGTTAGTMNNLGAVTASQTKAVAYGDSAATQAFVLPAGAFIRQVRLYQSTTYTSGTSGTFKIYLNGTEIGSVAITTGTAGILGVSPGSDAQTALWTNIGTTDGIITYTGATLSAGAGVLEISYIVRLQDGTYQHTSFSN